MNLPQTPAGRLEFLMSLLDTGFECTGCGSLNHDDDASFCKRCGTALTVRDSIITREMFLALLEAVG